MKTLHLYLIAMAATLAGCSSDEAVAPAGDVGDDDICFTTAVADAASRAACVESDVSLQGTGFWVKALKVDGTPLWPNDDNGDMLHFKYDTSTSKFVPDVADDDKTVVTKWPTGQTIFLYASNIDPSEKQLTKRAASDVPAGQDADPDYGGQMYTGFTSQVNDVTQHKDYVYATNYGTRADFTNGTVPLHFKHMFCQVEVQAKNSNPAYTVKVKGYKLHLTYNTGSFLLPTPVKITSSDATATATAPDGSWLNRTCISPYYYDFDSGYKNDFTTTASSIYDTDGDDYFLLTEEAQKISNGVDDGHAMILPLGPFNTANVAAGACIYLIVQIDYNVGEDISSDGKLPLFPACRLIKDDAGNTNELANNLGTRVSYSGLPKYYGRIYVPYSIPSDWLNYAGKKVTFVLDLSDGLGWVDRHRPNPVDPNAEGYNAEDGTATTGSAAVLNSNVDPYSANDLVLGDMGITVTLSDWENISETPSTSQLP